MTLSVRRETAQGSGAAMSLSSSKSESDSQTAIADKTAVCYVCHDDDAFLEASIKSFRAFDPNLPVTVFISDCAWDGSVGKPDRCEAKAKRAGAEVIRGKWQSEADQRRFALETMKHRGIRWLFIPDGDEIVQKRLLKTLLALAKSDAFNVFRVRMWTFWKTTRHRIFPPEELAPILLINAQTTTHLEIREYSGDRSVTLGFEHGCLLHLSYVGSDERILRKISTWSHKHQLIEEWFNRVWLAWDKDNTLRNLHPTNPHCYGFAERIPVPEELRGINDGRPVLGEPELPKRWLKISVVIPTYGGPIDLLHTLESLSLCGVVGSRHARRHGPKKRESQETWVPLLHEVIVVDDCSPEDITEVVKRFPFVKLIRNKENLGFGSSCNIGFEACTGDVVLFLNSDTRLPRAGLISLARALMASGTIGAVGPLSNRAGYEQGFSPTMVDLQNLELYSCDFSHRAISAFEAEMVIGFCLMIPRSVLEEVGLFDPRFGKCLYEDTDLIYRIQRAGFKTMICPSSFVWHEGSRSLGRTGIHPSIMLAEKKAIYEEKWRLDVECGYVPHLPGQGKGRIQFNPDRKPEILIPRLRELARQLDISVCMIVKNRENTIGPAIKSLLDIFPQVVVLDTGSTDRTMDIARELGAEVHEMTWPDSFSIARNKSIALANGKWIFWIDSDDTVPFPTIEEIIVKVMNAPPGVNGFCVGIQFVEAIPGTGTRVDHIRVFRRDARHYFEGRIHENVLPSLRATGGQIGWINNVILHSGYDRTDAGQSEKRVRDRYHLALELKDRPGHTFTLFCFGMTAYFSGRYRPAIGWLRRSIANARGETHERKAYALYGMSLKAMGRFEEAEGVFRAGLDAVGEDPEIRYNIGNTLCEMGRFAEAREQFLAMPKDTAGYFASIDIGILNVWKYLSLARACFGMGLESEGKHWLREAIAVNPHFSPAASALFDAANRTGDVNAARDAVQAMLVAEGPGEAWALMRAGIAEMCGVNVDQELVNLTNEMPQAIGPGLIFCRRLIASGRIHEALPLLGRLEDLGCAEAAHHLGTFELGRGHLDHAIYHTQLALQLSPGNFSSMAQLETVELAMDDMEPLDFPMECPDGNVLVGPHAGALGPATCERSVVVVTYNSKGTIKECIEKVLPTLGEADELIVVDNASSDSTREIVEEFAGSDARIAFLPQPENLGYSRACNIGILASHGAKITALNPDAFVDTGWQEALGAHLVGNVAAVGPVSDNVTADQFVGHFLGERHPKTEEISGILRSERAGRSSSTKLLMGVCLMMRRDLLDLHGLLCEETRLGADDLELSWRYQRLGYELKVVPSVFVRHVGGASFATLSSLERRKQIHRSDRALIRRLKAFYGDAPIPTSYELWGCDIFAEALSRKVAE